MRLIYFLLVSLFPVNALALGISVDKSVYLNKSLVKQLEKQSSEVCKFTDCTNVTASILNYLGYRTSVEGNVVHVKSCEIIRKVILRGASRGLFKQLSDSLKAIKIILLNKKLNEELLLNVRQLLLLKLHSIGYRSSKVEFLKERIPTGYILTVKIDAGPLFTVSKVETVAPAKFKPFVNKNFHILYNKPVNNAKIKSIVEKLENFFIKQGYYNVSITYFLIPTKEKGFFIEEKKPAELFVRVKTGKRYEIKFKGNGEFPTRILKRLLTFPSAKSLDEFEIENSVRNIEDFYKSNGYPYAKVSVKTEEKDKKNVLLFVISEGKYVVIKNVKITPGNIKIAKIKSLVGKPFSIKKINQCVNEIKLEFIKSGYDDAKVSYQLKGREIVLSVVPGKKYIVEKISTSGDVISCYKRLKLKLPTLYSKEFEENLKGKLLECYFENGYPDVSVQVKKRMKELKDRNSIHLVISMSPGKRYKFCYIVVDGLKRTDLRNIKNLFTLKPEETFSRTKLVKQYALLSESRLFSKVNIVSLRTDGCISEIIELGEGPRLHANGFFGYGTDSGYVSNGILSSTSPLGLGIKYSLFGNYRQKEGYDAVFRLTKPSFPFKDYETSYSIVKKEEVYESFTTDRIIYNFSIGRSRTKYLKQKLGIEVAREKIRKTSITTKKNFVERNLYYIQTYDKRNNAFNPSNGYMIKFKSSLSGCILGGNTDYYMAELKSIYLLPLFRGSVVALRAGVGIMKSIRGSSIPLQDRFYLGGAESVRGYKYGTISPRDKRGNFIGGNAYGLLSLEERFNFMKRFQLALFYDSGNVFQQSSDFKLDLSDWYSSIGLGLRYLTPVGPLRFDYGYKLKKVPGQGSGRIHISFGFPF